MFKYQNDHPPNMPVPPENNDQRDRAEPVEDEKNNRKSLETPPSTKDAAKEPKPRIPAAGKWHPASRDWNICGLTVLILLLAVITALAITEVLRNFMLIIFFTIFVLFLGVISLHFKITALRLVDFQAAFFPRKKDSKGFPEKLRMGLSEGMGEPEEIESVAGHTFGLLSHVMTLKLTSGEIVELNELRFNSGFTLGLYLLVHAPADSGVWAILDRLLKE